MVFIFDQIFPQVVWCAKIKKEKTLLGCVTVSPSLSCGTSVDILHKWHIHKVKNLNFCRRLSWKNYLSYKQQAFPRKHSETIQKNKTIQHLHSGVCVIRLISTMCLLKQNRCIKQHHLELQRTVRNCAAVMRHKVALCKHLHLQLQFITPDLCEIIKPWKKQIYDQLGVYSTVQAFLEISNK